MTASTWLRTQAGPDPRVAAVTRTVLWFGITLALLWPAARGHNAWVGWLPLWLIGMPLSAWCALHRGRWRALLDATAATNPGRRVRRIQAQRRLPRRRMAFGWDV